MGFMVGATAYTPVPLSHLQASQYKGRKGLALPGRRVQLLKCWLVCEGTVASQHSLQAHTLPADTCVHWACLLHMLRCG
jgi:hypothetical protein